ncbi:unnamed protein product [Sphagnum jensenii]|uniref:Uncharacterized protein n=1 Tax=Sphagnum jensenii TaxID=128206 RepID=A0ABP0XFA0_9BRYO
MSSTTAMAARRWGFSAPAETAKLEKETREKMKRLAEVRAAMATERQVCEELRREASTKGWWSATMPKGHQENMHEKGLKSSTRTLPVVPATSLKLKQSSKSCCPITNFVDYSQVENKLVRSLPAAQGPDMKAFREFDEAASNASFAGALAEWRNSGSTTKTEVQTTLHIETQHKHQSPISDTEKLTQRMTPPPTDHCTMGIQTEKPTVANNEIESPVVQHTYFQHLCMQDSMRFLP